MTMWMWPMAPKTSGVPPGTLQLEPGAEQPIMKAVLTGAAWRIALKTL